jgi:hypothetical protein
MPRYTKDEIRESRRMLLEELKPGDYVYCELVHVNGMGTRRVIQLHRFRRVDPHGRLDRRVLGYHAARVLGCTFSTKPGREGVVVNGGGMDMGFHLVYSLAGALFHDDAAKLGPKHKVHGRNGEKYETTDAGYLLKHEWL